MNSQILFRYINIYLTSETLKNFPNSVEICHHFIYKFLCFKKVSKHFPIGLTLGAYNYVRLPSCSNSQMRFGPVSVPRLPIKLLTRI